MDDRSRRWFLGAVGAALGGSLAGCTGGDGPEAADTTTGTPGGTDGSTTDPTTTDEDTPITERATSTIKTEGGTTAGSTTEAATTTPELDLREANVTGVEFERRDGKYRFSVTLYHDDDGEDGYANWWQVESLEGERLGRRKLLHAHGTREFTRSETVSIPDGVGTVVIRGHDQTHGYGGQAAVVDLGTGTVEFVQQGSEPDEMPRRP